MDSLLVGQDLRVELAAHGGAAPDLAAVQRVVGSLHAAVEPVWPGTAWDWMHGADTVPRALAALVRRIAAHVDGPDSESSYYAPCGCLIARDGARTFAFAIELHGTWRGGWHVAIEPRLRRKLLGFITSDRIPGTRELDGRTAQALTGILRAMLASLGPSASMVAGNPHRFRRECLVFP